MNCMKCGVELKTSGVFCESCLADMERYPVKPNITVQLPVRPAPAPIRKRQRRQKYIKPEDQIRHLKKVRRWLTFLLVVALLAFAATSTMLINILEGDDSGFDIGQNYGTIESDETQ